MYSVLYCVLFSCTILYISALSSIQLCIFFKLTCVQQVLGQEGGGFRIVMTGFDCSRPLIAAGAVGLAQRALDESTRYAIERKAFGRPIAEVRSHCFYTHSCSVYLFEQCFTRMCTVHCTVLYSTSMRSGLNSKANALKVY